MLVHRLRRWPNIVPAQYQLLMFPVISQQTRDIVPLLVQCWSTVYDAGPTLNQQLDNVSCLLGYEMYYAWCMLRYSSCWTLCHHCCYIPLCFCKHLALSHSLRKQTRTQVLESVHTNLVLSHLCRAICYQLRSHLCLVSTFPIPRGYCLHSHTKNFIYMTKSFIYVMYHILTIHTL